MANAPWNKKWNKKTIHQSALQFDNLTAWGNAEPGARSAAYRLGIIKEVTSHMRKQKEWTYDRLKNSANKYETKADWRRYEESAYVTAKSRSLIDELCKHMVTLRRNPYTKEEVRKIASRYTTKIDFINEDGAVYQVAHKKGWLEEISSHMKPVGNKMLRLIYSIKVKETNKIYIGLSGKPNKRKVVHFGSKRFENFNKKDLIFEELTELLPIDVAVEKEVELINHYKNLGMSLLNTSKGGELGTSARFWTDEKILASAKNYTSIASWRKNDPLAYEASTKSFIHKDAISHMPDPSNQKKWYKDTIIQSAKKFKYSSEWKANEAGAYLAARRIGVLAEATKHMEKKSPIQKWTKEKVRETAKKFQILSRWREAYPGAVGAAYSKGYIKDVTSHMTDGRRFPKKWTKEKVRKTALKFKVLSRWRETYPGAVGAAYKNGYIKDVTSHMTDGRKLIN